MLSRLIHFIVREHFTRQNMIVPLIRISSDKKILNSKRKSPKKMYIFPL
jgi:hypothetical protein